MGSRTQWITWTIVVATALVSAWVVAIECLTPMVKAAIVLGLIVPHAGLGTLCVMSRCAEPVSSTDLREVRLAIYLAILQGCAIVVTAKMFVFVAGDFLLISGVVPPERIAVGVPSLGLLGVSMGLFTLLEMSYPVVSVMLRAIITGAIWWLWGEFATSFQGGLCARTDPKDVLVWGGLAVLLAVVPIEIRMWVWRNRDTRELAARLRK
jgi:hypothetical protein